MNRRPETRPVPDEDQPTGTAWRTPRPTQPCTAEEQAEHWADLDEVVQGWRVGDAGRRQSYRRSR
ncbi:hypothetical protein [Streptomyces kebangsaanensis]|uniref:hypothetical protein n=1 Tax=Streptomyces kebangsaanensis TaxID=864058 RepID=UPI000B1B0B6B|nr:hypothetical protein [Streptomyces kebangsaanensis]